MGVVAASSTVCSAALEVANTVVASFAVTELLLRRRSLRDIRIPLCVLAALNCLLSSRIHAFVAYMTAIHSTHIEGNHNSSAGAEPSTITITGERETAASTHAVSPAVQGFLRTFLIAFGFAAVAYLDVRRLRQDNYGIVTYARELRAAMWFVLPVFPFLVMGSSCIFLVLTALLEKVGFPEHLGEELIVYGQFYVPFSVVYWIIKKDWLIAARSTPILPVAGSVAGKGRNDGSRRRPTD
mmetsp:Transcript_104633/g.207802  ORF Transcript_104633/g.207802 Transcript_104633/m.207802 type:complete len:240 (+) Transcript_104633:55-774(+)